MRGLALILSLHFGREPATGDRWFSADKAMHFFTAALVESASFSALRGVGLDRSHSLVGAVIVTGAVGVGKEIHDLRFGGDPSVKDLAWDGAGMLAAAVLLRRTEP
jgi:uncharacterized protein YfiM (DUF2279 family)